MLLTVLTLIAWALVPVSLFVRPASAVARVVARWFDIYLLVGLGLTIVLALIEPLWSAGFALRFFIPVGLALAIVAGNGRAVQRA